jgi:hypothetical protein
MCKLWTLSEHTAASDTTVSLGGGITRKAVAALVTEQAATKGGVTVRVGVS